jgi:hypothetical protein
MVVFLVQNELKHNKINAQIMYTISGVFISFIPQTRSKKYANLSKKMVIIIAKFKGLK